MSAAVLVADSWQPSIVQLVPFAKTNIRRSTSFREPNDSRRGFPVLAVTRGTTGLSSEESAVSISTYSSLISDSAQDTFDSGQYSGPNSTASAQKEKRFRKIARHSSMRENRSDIMVKFTIQDLNEQNESASQRRNSVCSSDTGISLSTVSATGSSVSNSLPKPTFSEKKYLYRQNGFKKSASFTPGEMELQKQKDQYTEEQAQKRKKYKLNVNQLPRSNTPIQDHDPDKLNMKQVIRFLQKQKPSASPRPDTISKKPSERFLFEATPKTAPSNLTVGDSIRSDLKTSDSMRSRSSEINISCRSKLVSRDSDASSSRTSPTSNTRYFAQQNDKGSVSKSYSEKHGLYSRLNESRARNQTSHDKSKEHDKNRNPRKRVKEFKLHRFLTVSPNGEGQKTNPLIISNVAQSRSNNWASVREGLKSEGGDKNRSKADEQLPFRRVSSERPLPSHYRSFNKANPSTKIPSSNEKQNETDKMIVDYDRNHTTKSANGIYYKTPRFQKWNPRDDVSISDSEDGKLSLTSSSMIRLPSVHDFLEEDDEGTVYSSSKSDFEVKTKIQESDLESELNRETNISRSSVDSVKSSLCIPILASSHRKGFTAKPKQSLHISLPKEEDDTKEIRLSLRQEKDLTAHRSYMSDIATSRTTDSLSMVCNHANGNMTPASNNAFNEKNSFRISTVSVRNGKLEDCWVCDDTRLSPDQHMRSRTIGALSTN